MIIQTENKHIEELSHLRVLQQKDDWQEDYQGSDDKLFAQTKQFLEEHLNKDLFIFAEFQDDAIIATCGLSLFKTLPQCCDNGVYGYVCNVFTLEKFRGRGIQTNLMAHLMAFVENKKIKRLLLSSDNPTAIHIYQKFGFKKDDWGYKWMKR